MRYMIAAGVVIWGSLGAGAIALFIGRGKLINEWRDYCAESAKANLPRYQQFDVEDQFVAAEIASLDKQFEVR